MMKVQELKSTYSDPINLRYVCLGIELLLVPCPSPYGHLGSSRYESLG